MVPGEYISNKEPSKIPEKKQCAYKLFLVHLPYSINKAILIHVFYRPWYQHYIIWVIYMHNNISSGVSKSIFWQFRIKSKCNYDVIFLWDITKKKRKNTQLLY